MDETPRIDISDTVRSGDPISADELQEPFDWAAEAATRQIELDRLRSEMFDVLYPIREDSNLHKHALAQLNGQGLLDADSDYDGFLGECALQLIKVFAAQGHSGYSAMATIELFTRLASFDSLEHTG